MSNNYFERLYTLARKLDKGIEELDDAWKFPQLFVGRCADVTKETEESLELLMNSIQSTKDGANELLLKVTETNSSAEAFIKEAQLQYDTIKQNVDDLETVFKEYGYRYDKDSIDNSLEIKDTEITSNVFVEGNSMEEIIFTPDLSWRCKKKSTNKTSLNGSKYLSENSAAILHKMTENISECKQNKTVQQLESTNHCNESTITFDSSTEFQNTMLDRNVTKSNGIHKKYLTPLRDRPREQIYSRHFYSSLKKSVKQ